MRLIALIAALVLLAGCATLSEDACRAGDWRGIGYADGTKGRDAAFIQQHAKACADYGITPKFEPWAGGRQEGLKVYCTPSRAWREGAQGRRLRPVCPNEDLDRLERANSRGLTYHRIEDEIGDARREIRSINQRLLSLPADDPSRSALISERAALRLDIALLRARLASYRHW